MAHDVSIPAIGESVTEGTIAQWLINDGEWVDEGTPLYELETDKVSSEVAAEVSGVLKIIVADGETVEVGGVIASIDTSADKPAGDSTANATATEATPEPEPAAAPSSDDNKISPAAKKMLAEENIPASSVTGSGRNGTITKADVLAHVAKGSETPASPAAPTPAPAPAATVPAASDTGVTRKKMTPLRKRIAQRLVQAQRTAAILTTFNEVDMSHCMALRKKYKEAFAEKHNTGLGFMSFFTTATVKALEKYPLINARIDGDDIVQPNGIHMGIAVGTDRGLVVPVLRNAEAMSFADIESGIRGYAKRARDGKLTIQDMEGGSFTITNGGVYGSLMSTPIINPPQSGILGMHAIQDRPVAVDGQVVVRPMMYIALSYDHRIVDGAEAVGFLVRIKELIEEPEKLIFDI